MSEDYDLSKTSKELAIGSLLRQAPPGEFVNVFSDLRLLAKNDKAMHEQAAEAWALHNKDNFTPLVKDGLEVLLTRHNDLGNSRFFDPEQKVSFRYCHMTREVKDIELYPIDGAEDESWRVEFHQTLNEYVKGHYKEGICSVFRKPVPDKKIFVACIEGHQFNPAAFWNGLWRSEWMFDLTPPVTQAMGNILVQVHYYEDGNIHLAAGKSVEETLFLNSEKEAAHDLTQMVENADNQFQAALMEEYDMISDHTMKKFRRSLPITHTILDWNKILASKISMEKSASE